MRDPNYSMQVPHGTSISAISWYIMKQKISDIVQAVYWWLPIGASITLLWPQHPNSDPNDAWRPHLEEHVGKQGIHWQWRLSQSSDRGYINRSSIDIKFLRKKDATMFALKYGD